MQVTEEAERVHAQAEVEAGDVASRWGLRRLQRRRKTIERSEAVVRRIEAFGGCATEQRQGVAGAAARPTCGVDPERSIALCLVERRQFFPLRGCE